MVTKIPLPGGVTDLRLGTAPLRLVVGKDGAQATVDITHRDVRDPTSQDVMTVIISGSQLALSGT